VVRAQGDIRRDREVQHLLAVCIELQPRLEVSATVDNPFADVDLIPRAMQCQEDLSLAMGLYNDSLMAVEETFAISAQAPETEAPATAVPVTAAAPPPATGSTSQV